jgi:hypothetical protein
MDRITVITRKYQGDIVSYTVEGVSDGAAFGLSTSKPATARAEVDYWTTEAKLSGRDYIVNHKTAEIVL